MSQDTYTAPLKAKDFLKKVKSRDILTFRRGIKENPQEFIEAFKGGDDEMLGQVFRSIGNISSDVKAKVEGDLMSQYAAFCETHNDTGNPPKMTLEALLGPDKQATASAETWDIVRQYLIDRRKAWTRIGKPKQTPRKGSKPPVPPPPPSHPPPVDMASGGSSGDNLQVITVTESPPQDTEPQQTSVVTQEPLLKPSPSFTTLPSFAALLEENRAKLSVGTQKDPPADLAQGAPPIPPPATVVGEVVQFAASQAPSTLPVFQFSSTAPSTTQMPHQPTGGSSESITPPNVDTSPTPPPIIPPPGASANTPQLAPGPVTAPKGALPQTQATVNVAAGPHVVAGSGLNMNSPVVEPSPNPEDKSQDATKLTPLEQPKGPSPSEEKGGSEKKDKDDKGKGSESRGDGESDGDSDGSDETDRDDDTDSDDSDGGGGGGGSSGDESDGDYGGPYANLLVSSVPLSVLQDAFLVTEEMIADGSPIIDVVGYWYGYFVTKHIPEGQNRVLSLPQDYLKLNPGGFAETLRELFKCELNELNLCEADKFYRSLGFRLDPRGFNLLNMDLDKDGQKISDWSGDEKKMLMDRLLVLRDSFLFADKRYCVYVGVLDTNNDEMATKVISDLPEVLELWKVSSRLFSVHAVDILTAGGFLPDWAGHSGFMIEVGVVDGHVVRKRVKVHAREGRSKPPGKPFRGKTGVSRDDSDTRAERIARYAEKYKRKEVEKGKGEQIEYNAKLSKGAKAFRRLPMPTQVMVAGKEIVVRPWQDNDSFIHLFSADNNLAKDDVSDNIFCVVMNWFTKYGFIIPNENSADQDTKVKAGYLVDSNSWDSHPACVRSFRKHFQQQARPLATLAMASYTQGGWISEIPWADSYCEVQGHYFRERRLRSVVKLILASNSIEMLMQAYTIGEIKALNNVYTYRFLRIAAPGLVKRALDLMKQVEVIKHFNPDEVDDYRKVHKAGVIAHIAGGPLKGYCKGSIDALNLSDEDDKMPLCALKPIERFPEHLDTIRKAYIVLQANNVKFGEWYQGKRAYSNSSNEDKQFEALVDATVRAQEKRARKRVSAKEINVEIEAPEENAEKILAMNGAW